MVNRLNLAGGEGADEVTLPPMRPEPERLRAELCELARTAPAEMAETACRRLAETLWRSWRPVLAAQGVTAALFRAAVAGAAREVRLWVSGDRPFDQLQASLAGRALRRAVHR